MWTPPSHQLYLVPVWLITAGEKHSPELTVLDSDSWLFPHIPCVFAPYLSYGAPQKSTSTSPIFFFFQRPCLFSIELLEQRKRSPLTASTVCLRACVLSSLLTVNSLNPPLAVGDPEIVSLCQLHSVSGQHGILPPLLHTHTQAFLNLFMHSTIFKRASLVSRMVKNGPAMQETWIQPLGWEDPLEEYTATYSSILAWGIQKSLAVYSPRGCK